MKRHKNVKAKRIRSRIPLPSKSTMTETSKKKYNRKKLRKPIEEKE